MKTKICISIEEDVDNQVKELLEDSIFRNKSHAIEYVLKKFLKEKNGKPN